MSDVRYVVLLSFVISHNLKPIINLDISKTYSQRYTCGFSISGSYLLLSIRFIGLVFLRLSLKGSQDGFVGCYW